MESFRIDEIARRLMDNLPPALRATQRDLESNFRAVLRASLGKLDLVTRDEFDTQSRVLERTRARLEALEERVRAMEGPAEGTTSAG
jgi:BMFP domain-containing protein YqiC